MSLAAGTHQQEREQRSDRAADRGQKVSRRPQDITPKTKLGPSTARWSVRKTLHTFEEKREADKGV